MTREAAFSRAFAVVGALCALVPAVAMWGFTVDDALIPVRYAHNLARGAGYRFDMHFPSTDGVTPLPWVFVLRPLVAADPLTTLVRAKVLGVMAWGLGGAALGARVGRMLHRDDARGARVVLAVAGLLVMGLAFPLGAWAASGMETGVAMALATVAVTRLERPKQAALLAGCAATLRPEMVVWAVALAMGATVASGAASKRAAGWLGAFALAAAPFATCAVIRLVVFGRLAPLAVLAKPSDLAHGMLYVGAATVVVLTPVLACAPLALARRRDGSDARAPGVARVVVVAFVAHAAAVVAAGGDWMPYARLVVPVAPSLVLAFVDVAPCAKLAWCAARLLVATALGLLLVVRAAPAGRSVMADRTDLVRRARPALARASVVAALDVGWVGAATDARIVDLAGLTDPAIALLPGGHTSKRVDVAMLLDRGVDTVVVYSELRVVEARILRSELFESRFERGETLPLGTRGASYTLYQRRP